MSMNRWKVAACTLTLGVGGLAVFATDKKDTPPKDTPKDTPPAITLKPAVGADTPSGPAKPALAPPVLDFDLDVPNVTLPPAKTAEAAPKPAGKEPVFVPVDLPPLEIVPVKAETDVKKEPAPKPDPAKKEEPKPALDKKPDPAPKPPVVDDGFDIKLPSAPKAPETPPPPPPLTEIKKPEPAKPLPPEPLLKGDATLPPPPVNPLPPLNTDPVKPVPSSDPVKLVPVKPVDTAAVPVAPATARLKMTLRMGDGKPRFEIRNSASEELLLKVYGEKIELSAPQDGRPSTLAGVSAIGRVKFTAPGLEGTCDHLTILSGTGEVLMKGNIHLKTKRGKSWSEMTAEKMVYQIGSTGLSTPSAPRNPVTPASYIPD